MAVRAAHVAAPLAALVLLGGMRLVSTQCASFYLPPALSGPTQYNFSAYNSGSPPLQLRHCFYQFSGCYMLPGNLDFMWTAVPALNGNASGISFRSTNFPTYYMGIMQGVVNTEGSLRMGGIQLTGSNLDNASWIIVDSLIGAPGAVSLQSLSSTPGVNGLYMTLNSGVSSGACIYAAPQGDIALSTGQNAAAASWVIYPPPVCAFGSPSQSQTQTQTLSQTQTQTQTSSTTPTQSATGTQACNAYLPALGTVYNLSAFSYAGLLAPLQARHCSYQIFASPMVAGNADFLFKAVPALTGSAIGVSFQSTNYPTYYIGALGPVGANTAEGSLRIGIVLPGSAPDNATWSIVPGLAGGYNTYSLQSMSLTPGVGGLYMSFLSGTLTGTCAANYVSPAGDVTLTTGTNTAGATWVLYPPLPFVSCTQSQSRSPTPSPTQSVTPSVTQSNTVTVTASSSGTTTVTMSGTGSSTSTATASSTVTQCPSQTSTQSVTPTTSMTGSASGTVTVSQALSGSQTRSPTQSLTPSLSPTSSSSQHVTPTTTLSQGATSSPMASPTLSLTSSSSPSQARTASLTQSQTTSQGSSGTLSQIPSSAATPSSSASETETPSISGSQMPSQTLSSSQGPTNSQSGSSTRSQVVTSSVTPTSTTTESQTKTQWSSGMLSQTPSSAATPSGSPSGSQTSSLSGTKTPSQSTSSTPSQGASSTQTGSSTSSQVASSSDTPSMSTSGSQTLSQVGSSSFSQTALLSPSPNSTVSFSSSISGSQAATRNPSPSSSATAVVSPSWGATPLLSPSASQTSLVVASFTVTGLLSPTLSTGFSVKPTATPCALLAVPLTITLLGGVTPVAIATPLVGVLLRLSLACYLGLPVSAVAIVSASSTDSSALPATLADISAVNAQGGSCSQASGSVRVLREAAAQSRSLGNSSGSTIATTVQLTATACNAAGSGSSYELPSALAAALMTYGAAVGGGSSNPNPAPGPTPTAVSSGPALFAAFLNSVAGASNVTPSAVSAAAIIVGAPGPAPSQEPPLNTTGSSQGSDSGGNAGLAAIAGAAGGAAALLCALVAVVIVVARRRKRREHGVVLSSKEASYSVAEAAAGSAVLGNVNRLYAGGRGDGSSAVPRDGNIMNKYPGKGGPPPTVAVARLRVNYTQVVSPPPLPVPSRDHGRPFPAGDGGVVLGENPMRRAATSSL